MNLLTTKKTKQKNKFSTHTLAAMAMSAAVLCISSYISITLPNGSHITFLNLVITLITLLFPVSQAVCIISLWLLMGIAGLPVFAGGMAGLGYLCSPWGGYNIAFLLTAIFIPLLCGKNYHRIRCLTASITAVIFIDLFGSLWVMMISHLSFPGALLIGFLPFIALDLIKAVIAAQLVPAFQRIIKIERK